MVTFEAELVKSGQVETGSVATACLAGILFIEFTIDSREDLRASAQLPDSGVRVRGGRGDGGGDGRGRGEGRVWGR